MLVRNQVHQLVATVQEGRILDAFDQFYAEDVVMQENGSQPTVGKKANRVREEQFVASVASVHAVEAGPVIADGNHSSIHWLMDYTGTDGNRYRLDQVATQEWKDGQIVLERFFYDTASVLVEGENALAS